MEQAVAKAQAPEPGGRVSTLGRLSAWAARVNLERNLALLLVVAAIASGTTTFAAMTGSLPITLRPSSVLLLLNLDLVLLLALAALVSRRLVILWLARRQRKAGARLHARMVALFSLIAVLPTIVIATFSVVLFDVGLQGWFSERVRTALDGSLAVAQGYLHEHQQTITADVLAMAQDLNREGPLLLLDPQRLNQVMAAQAAVRSLTEAVIFDATGQVLARAGFSIVLEFDPQIPNWALRQAASGEPVVLTSEEDDRVRALVRLESLAGAFLYVGRPVDPQILGHIDRTKGAVRLYQELEGQRSGIQVTFALLFAVIALMLLLAAIWVGLAFANYLSRPIGALIDATEKVRGGDLAARVDEHEAGEEIGMLALAFNRMTNEIGRQQDQLLDANRQLDLRSRFIEAVLGGVSAGVLGLDTDGRITLPNRSACALLGLEESALRGRPLGEVAPEMAELLADVRARPKRLRESSVMRVSQDGSQRTLRVRIAAELDSQGVVGYVVTFDDISELLSAQRKAAWSDIARRIAHEIKNPLTPIQLSAERLQRKYLSQVQGDSDTFRACTDTIVRQVGEIGRMVDEFSSFARMPAPVFSETDLCEIVRPTLPLEEQARPAIAYSLTLPEAPAMTLCDGQQVARAVINLLQNAAESIEAREGGAPSGRIAVRLQQREGQLALEIVDNGRGLPKGDRHRLTEPYVTHREKGTGLGLAIVKKIMEDHGGELLLEDASGGGAKVTLLFPALERAAEEQREPATARRILYGA
ncbi:MAG: ATP-binding protein [Kiloniellales bacterium]